MAALSSNLDRPSSRANNTSSGDASARTTFSTSSSQENKLSLLHNLALFYLACALFLANFTLGMLVQARIVDTRPFRWLHHALFSAVFIAAVIAVAAGFLWGLPYRWTLLPALGLFAALPYIRAGTIKHACLASGALLLYAASFAQTM